MKVLIVLTHLIYVYDYVVCLTHYIAKLIDSNYSIKIFTSLYCALCTSYFFVNRIAICTLTNIMSCTLQTLTILALAHRIRKLLPHRKKQRRMQKDAFLRRAARQTFQGPMRKNLIFCAIDGARDLHG